MPSLSSILQACVALLALAAVVPAGLAQPRVERGDAGTVWHCWYNDDTTFRCRLARAQEGPGDRIPGAYVPQPRRTLNPRRGPLPAIVRTIHEHPARLYGRTITIPLFSPPIDRDFAAMLVDGVMCNAQPACRVRIFHSAAAAAEGFDEDPARDDVDADRLARAPAGRRPAR